MRSTLLIALLLCYAAIGYTQDSLKSYTTQRISGAPPKIDGLANDPAWDQVPWGGGDFTQRSPDDGAAPSVQTHFKILYDEKNLYILTKNLDPDPEKIVSRMSRRDGFDGDWVEVNIDSYYDKRTAFSFTSSVSGVKGDEYVSNNGNNWDANWDPIWYLRTSINDEGWIAEFRIPLSQLRFANKEEHVWGIQFTRRFFRNEERSNWQYVPQDASGWVHLFGELRGIKGVKPQKQLEIQPYITGRVERFEKEEGNPFRDGSDAGLDVGLDAKIGITSDITLDLTVNPDFGQVEADPSQVNLSAFQLFFREQRPFFIEGNNILDFRIVDFRSNNLFYSRRIGRRPQGYVDTDESGEDNVTEYVENKDNTRILGAAKITGKNKKGFSWGILESVTAKESVEVDSLGFRRDETVEPLTNYLVGRVQQDINQGKTIVGGMFTATNRQIEDDRLNFLHDDAYSAGVDFTHFWKDRDYFVSAKFAASKVRGSEESIENTQRASERFFQRPDNRHTRLDTTRTTLSGTGGTVMVGKRSGKIIYDLGYTWRSPQLALNDIGFLSQTDFMTQWLWVQYRKLNPFGPFRSMRVNMTQWYDMDFGGVSLEKGVDTNVRLEFKNFWRFNSGVSVNSNSISNADLRGGPAITYPGRYSQWIFMATDNRKKLRFAVNPWWGRGFDGYQQNVGLWTELRYRPTNSLNISVSPSVRKNKNTMQYVTTQSFDNQDRYIIATINQKTYNLSVRLTYMITPNLSIQYWGQPFAAAGSYSDFKKVTNPNAENFNSRFESLSATFHSEDDVFNVDENNDGTIDYSISNPDFNFVQLRSNMVMRWEYIPGSTLFLVWTQSRTDFPTTGDSSFNHLYDGLFSKKPHNIFLIKYTYRFIL
ncbi:hypothetical protein E1176_19605 [Fulvivirga sp. RKSG066]|uniref:DUF5916 domain-containing protein n=1 Tax=Fulvivirga aurantia TaxID=2529383 RepID=UPI0012BBD158|nr:DUF5916 domain-containing protein [Fulvivirga aurantia]MTI23244.1 hypothetical protein [Fulvivirga aurantia]